MDYGTTAVCNNTTGQIANNTVTAQNYYHNLVIKQKKTKKTVVEYSQACIIFRIELHNEDMNPQKK